MPFLLLLLVVTAPSSAPALSSTSISTLPNPSPTLNIMVEPRIIPFAGITALPSAAISKVTLLPVSSQSAFNVGSVPTCFNTDRYAHHSPAHLSKYISHHAKLKYDGEHISCCKLQQRVHTFYCYCSRSAGRYRPGYRGVQVSRTKDSQGDSEQQWSGRRGEGSGEAGGLGEWRREVRADSNRSSSAAALSPDLEVDLTKGVCLIELPFLSCFYFGLVDFMLQCDDFLEILLHLPMRIVIWLGLLLPSLPLREALK